MSPPLLIMASRICVCTGSALVKKVGVWQITETAVVEERVTSSQNSFSLCELLAAWARSRLLLQLYKHNEVKTAEITLS